MVNMSTSTMTDRPKIKDFMPEGTTFTDIHRKFRDNPDLCRKQLNINLTKNGRSYNGNSRN